MNVLLFGHIEFEILQYFTVICLFIRMLPLTGYGLYEFIIGIEFMGSSISVKSNQDGNSFKNKNAGGGYNREYRGNRQNRRNGPRFNRGNNFNQNYQQQQPLKMEQYPCR